MTMFNRVMLKVDTIFNNVIRIFDTSTVWFAIILIAVLYVLFRIPVLVIKAFITAIALAWTTQD